MVQLSPIIAEKAAVSGTFLGRLCRLARCAGAGVFATPDWIAWDGALPPPILSAAVLENYAQVFPEGLPAKSGFLLLVPIPAIDESRTQWLALWDDRPRSTGDSYALLARVVELVGQSAMAGRRIAERHRRTLLERASATARIGIWSCTLPDEHLTWTDGVYDLFELPRGSAIDRAALLAMYTPESARQMTALRAEAIATCGDFNFDAQIVTAKGNPRWMRITATVDGVNGKARRIFGMKQNITEEKHLAEQTRLLSETDVLTGLSNRSIFHARMQDLEGQRSGLAVGALILIDLDNFKMINDTFGHAYGDACLIKAGERLRQCAPPDASVARIGGDEFAILTSSGKRLDVEGIAQKILNAFDEPVQLGLHRHRVKASVGVAIRSCEDGETLYRNADAALYAAKSAGRSTWRLFGEPR